MKRLLLVILTLLPLALSAQVGDLPRSTPECEGVNPDLLNRFYHDLTTLPQVDVHHLMVLRHGKVIGELHATPYEAHHLHTLYSASKTVTALAVGLAVDDGLLTVDDKVSRYLRDKMPSVLTPALDSLTVRHLLMMASGREEELSIFEGDKDWLTAWFAGDFQAPGERFSYDSMCTHALATIVGRVTGKPLLEVVRERVFVPLHITEADWELAPDGVETAGWGLRLQTESEAKIGQLMLQGGKWNGTQVVSERWVRDMTRRWLSTQQPSTVALPFKTRVVRWLQSMWHKVRSWFTGYNVDDYFLGYGYQTKAIRHPRADSFFAAGYGGQLIYVVPAVDLVVVVNGRAANYGDELNTIYYRLVEPMISGFVPPVETMPVELAVNVPQGEATHPFDRLLEGSVVLLDSNLLGIKQIKITPSGIDRTIEMTDQRGSLRAVADCGQWRVTTGDDRPIYIMESREQLVGTRRPFTTAAAYAWQGDTLAMRMDWIDGGDNRRLWLIVGKDGDAVVVVNDNFDPLLTDTIAGKLLRR